MTEPDKKHHAPRFLMSAEFQELSRESFARHAASPEISPDAYFTQKITELRQELERKTLIYLDTCHWVHLRHVVLNDPRERPGYREVLSQLEALHARHRICCPISLLLFEELMKQSDPVTRLRTAQLMDRFSSGVCFQFPLELARNELRQFLLKTVANQPGEAKAWVWTKAGFLAGELFPTEVVLPPATDNLIQKAWTDLMWAIRLEHVIELLRGNWPQLDFWEKYAAASNSDAVFYRTSQMSYRQVLEKEKALLIRELLKEELETVGQEIWDAYPECRDVSQRQELLGYTSWNFPSLQILAGISAADMVTQVKFEANDMLDFRHAAAAIPYCHAVFCDNPMATRLRNKPCEFGKVYGAEILGRPEEMLDYLKGLG